MYVDMPTQTWSPGINDATHKSQSCCFPVEIVLPCAEVSQLWCWGCRGVAPRILYIATGCTNVFALLVAVKVQPRMLQNGSGIPAPFETFLRFCAATRAHFGAVGLHAFGLSWLRTLHVKNRNVRLYTGVGWCRSVVGRPKMRCLTIHEMTTIPVADISGVSLSFPGWLLGAFSLGGSDW